MRSLLGTDVAATDEPVAIMKIRSDFKRSGEVIYRITSRSGAGEASTSPTATARWSTVRLSVTIGSGAI